MEPPTSGASSSTRSPADSLIQLISRASDRPVEANRKRPASFRGTQRSPRRCSHDMAKPRTSAAKPARRLKVYAARLDGLNDYVVAAPNQGEALKAWDIRQNLFQ